MAVIKNQQNWLTACKTLQSQRQLAEIVDIDKVHIKEAWMTSISENMDNINKIIKDTVSHRLHKFGPLGVQSWSFRRRCREGC